MVEVTLKPPPPGPNGPKGLIRMHWGRKVKVAKRIVEEIWAQKQNQHIELKIPAIVSATRYAIRFMDEDNLVASLKIPIDSMVHLNILQGDSPKYMQLGEMKQERVKTRKEERMVLRVSWEKEKGAGPTNPLHGVD